MSRLPEFRVAVVCPDCRAEVRAEPGSRVLPSTCPQCGRILPLGDTLDDRVRASRRDFIEALGTVGRFIAAVVILATSAIPAWYIWHSAAGRHQVAVPPAPPGVVSAASEEAPPPQRPLPKVRKPEDRARPNVDRPTGDQEVDDSQAERNGEPAGENPDKPALDPAQAKPAAPVPPAAPQTDPQNWKTLALPNGEVLDRQKMTFGRANVGDLFKDPDFAVYEELHPNGKTAGLYAALRGRLDGPVISYHPNDAPRALGFFKDNRLFNAVRMWTQAGELSVYLECRANRPAGIACLLVGEVPVYVEERRFGFDEPAAAYLIQVRNGELVAVPVEDVKGNDAQKLVDLRERLVGAIEEILAGAKYSRDYVRGRFEEEQRALIRELNPQKRQAMIERGQQRHAENNARMRRLLEEGVRMGTP